MTQQTSGINKMVKVVRSLLLAYQSIMGNNNISGCFFLLVAFIICALAPVSCARVIEQQNRFQDSPDSLSRKSFPEGFVFGTASSAYQYEGAANEGGKGPSIWDTFVKTYPAKIKDRSSGSVAVDSYHRYKEDVALMKDIGFDAYRFSISWPRLLPRGKLSGGVNEEGIAYYNELINELVANEMKPVVTLFHWDLPQALEDDYSGFLSPLIVNDFQDFVELCYKNFGDRVKNWITLNEPLTFVNGGYATGQQAPGRCSKWVSPKCNKGDSRTEPYVVAHHLLLAHAAAVRVYKERYQSSQEGQIGITLSSTWVLPLSGSPADSAATSRAIAFMYDSFLEPLKSGSYPSEMVKYVGERLPQFTKEQSLMVQGSYDFLGINYYTTYYAYDVPCAKENFSSLTDSCSQMTGERNEISIGPQGGSSWLYVYPKGIFNLLLYTKNKMNNPIIYITENGIDEVNNGALSPEDNMRIDYHKGHFSYVQKAIEHGVDVRGYFVWSFLDNFEWNEGYTVRFGIISVDYKHQLRRYPKKSATWFKKFLHSNEDPELQLSINIE